ncbi:MAG: septal ring lytic transglycosylase RlpA family protein [Cyanobacteria bacterium P01_B01_bin.77]
MNRHFVGRVAVTALLSTLLPLSARANAQTAQTFDSSHDTETFEVSLTSQSNQSSESSSTETLQTFLQSSSTTVRVNAHAHEKRQAATVYVKNIPVLTYIDTSDSAEVVSGWLPSPMTQADGAIASASKMAAQLESMSAQDAAFTAHWDDGSYVVMAGDSPLVTLGDTVQLPDATANEAENALQVTNRLRRLLGDSPAEPVTEVIGRPAPVAPVQQVAAVRSSQSGMASWYGPGFHGRRSASGESFNQYAMTAAHRTLPFGTQVRVTNLNNGRQVVVRINDRGPYSHGRIIDLSAGAASEIGLQSAGVGPVQIEVLQ